jgi:hypothetical protein
MNHGRTPAYTFDTSPAWPDRAEMHPFSWLAVLEHPRKLAERHGECAA